MKHLSILLLAFALLAGLTACDDDDEFPSGPSGGGDTNAPGSTNIVVPSSLENLLFTGQVQTGSDPFATTGAFIITPVGTSSGTFTSTGMTFNGGPSSGNFTLVPAPGNEATLVLGDELLGTVTMSLLFQTSNTGTFSSTSSLGGSQTGTFLLQ